MKASRSTTWKIIILLLAVFWTLVFIALGNMAKAATLDSEFTNEDGDRICVYESHFKKHYVNVGFIGSCSFNVPDSQFEDEK